LRLGLLVGKVELTEGINGCLPHLPGTLTNILRHAQGHPGRLKLKKDDNYFGPVDQR